MTEILSNCKLFLKNFDVKLIVSIYGTLFEIGIIRLPIVGAYWLLLWGNYKFPYLTFDYYVKKLKSKLISCYLGDYFVIVANDYESIKEILAKDDFDGRVSAEFIRDRSFGKDLGNEKYIICSFFDVYAIYNSCVENIFFETGRIDAIMIIKT